MSQPGWKLPEGPSLGGFQLARVQGGLDVFVIDYEARPVLLPPDTLRRLGLTTAERAAGGLAKS